MFCSNDRGRSFEADIRAELESLQSKYPDIITVESQPRIVGYSGRTFIPDFSFALHFLHEISYYIIECQDRKRSQVEISDKIRSMKLDTWRNTAIFVYRSSIPFSTKRALKSQGVMVMSFKKFKKFLWAISETMSGTSSVEGGYSYPSDFTPPTRSELRE